MSRFLWLASAWFQSWQQTGLAGTRDRRTGHPEKLSRRDRSQKRLTIEAMEDRLLLSKTDLPALVTLASIERQVASQLTSDEAATTRP